MRLSYSLLLGCALAVLLLPGQVLQYVRRVPPAAAGGGITKTLLTTGSDASSTQATSASISPTADSDLFLCACFARTTGTLADVDASASGPTGVTWAHTDAATDRRYGFRRKCDVLHGAVDSSPGSGGVTISCDSGSVCAGTDDGMIWSIIQYEGLNSGTPYGTVVFDGDDSTATSQSVTVSGTPDAGDFLYTCFAWEDGDTLTPDADFGTTDHNTTDTNTGVRQILVGTNSSPPGSPIPDISGSGSNHSAGISFILEVAP